MKTKVKKLVSSGKKVVLFLKDLMAIKAKLAECMAANEALNDVIDAYNLREKVKR